MSTVNVYFGAQPSEGQIVSETVRARGIELLKIEPSKVIVTGGPTTIQPGYSVYKSHLPQFLEAAATSNPTRSTSSYPGIPDINPDTRLPINYPDLIVSWRVPVGEEVREQMKEYGFRDTVVRGKPAMIARRPTGELVEKALNHNVLTTSPTNENSVNIFSLRKCVLLKNIAEAFISVHQYPAFIDQDHESEFRKGMVCFLI